MKYQFPIRNECGFKNQAQSLSSERITGFGSTLVNWNRNILNANINFFLFYKSFLI
jgi:hypothetical protein